ncbi:MAG: FtsW/RodA/SpoVE family cell cycle protein [Clostridia bacterium]|nr:FtsW/RodA/SpoVE family cell cycle protein [Clostridia bacterium]
MFQAMSDFAVVGLRILLSFYAIFIVYHCFASMRRNKRPEKPLVMLFNEEFNIKIPVLFWENSIGRAKRADITIEDGTVSRYHCVLLRRKAGWFVNDIGSKSGTKVNGKRIQGRTKVSVDDTITIGGTSLTLLRGEEYDEDLRPSWFFSKASHKPSVASGLLLILVNLFHLFMTAEICVTTNKLNLNALMVFSMITLFSWVLYIFSYGVFSRKNFELETLAVWLSGLGSLLLVEQDMADAIVQVASMVAGAVLYMFILVFIKNPDRVIKWRWAIMILALGFLAVNLVFGTIEYGAANRIYIGGISVQPSEIVKIAYIFVGAAALDYLLSRRNFLEFIIFSALCVGALALMGDFGTALIFFITFLVISITRSGDYKTVILALVGAAFAVLLVLNFKPYIAERFSIWGHALDDPYDLGYQQAGTLTSIASGGLFGTGVGSGNLRYYGASETDLVFGIISEEMGLIIGITIAVAICGLVFYTRAMTTRSRSTFYSISALCAATLLLTQMSLNIFGCTDILPLTGVTLPFVSAGGSSMLSCWGLLAFIKAADERTYR